jgi:hypothetical protein
MNRRSVCNERDGKNVACSVCSPCTRLTQGRNERTSRLLTLKASRRKISALPRRQRHARFGNKESKEGRHDSWGNNTKSKARLGHPWYENASPNFFTCTQRQGDRQLYTAPHDNRGTSRQHQRRAPLRCRRLPRTLPGCTACCMTCATVDSTAHRGHDEQRRNEHRLRRRRTESIRS